MKLLTTSNLKIMKGQAYGYLTAILHLAPAKLSGFNVCPKASKGCAAACLNTAGRGVYSKVQDARIRKTLAFFNDQDAFMAQLVKDVKSVIRKAAKDGLIPAIRLNGTSDIRWETVKVTEMGKSLLTGEVVSIVWPNIMALFPNVQFYDYSKIANRRDLPANYHLTFSRSESNAADVAKALANGMNVAVVFATKKGAALPATYLNREVIDADTTDLRFLDKAGVICGLRGKGKARSGSFDNFIVGV